MEEVHVIVDPLPAVVGKSISSVTWSTLSLKLEANLSTSFLGSVDKTVTSNSFSMLIPANVSVAVNLITLSSSVGRVTTPSFVIYVSSEELQLIFEKFLEPSVGKVISSISVVSDNIKSLLSSNKALFTSSFSAPLKYSSLISAEDKTPSYTFTLFTPPL